jgi:homoserine/homoserine lactone efflux protein
MNLHVWGLYCLTVFLISGSPGPNMLHILTRSVDLGLRGSFPAMAGCMSALLVMLTTSALGLSALLLAVPGAFMVLRLVGTAYLVYLGIKAWRAPVADDADAQAAQAGLSRLRVFGLAFGVAISNPKALLLAVAFLPQFIDPARPQAPQFAIMIASFVVIETFWYFTYALGGRSAAAMLARPPVKRAFNRLTGVVFIAFGAALLKTQKA